MSTSTLPPQPSPLVRRSRPAERDAAEYAELRRRIVVAGLLAPQPAYYLAKFLSVGLMAASGLLVLLHGAALPLWLQLLAATWLAFVFGQIGLLGHDVAHGQVFHARRLAAAVGLLLGNLLLGISIDWWRHSHGAHHANPNHVDLDPAVNFAVLAFTPEQARRKAPRVRWLIRHQARLIVGFACFELLNLRAQSIAHLGGTWRRRPLYSTLEAALLALHVALYLAVVLGALGLGAGLVVAVFHHLLSGLYLTSLFAPNHKGMPVVYGAGPRDFVREQVLTARNVAGGRWIDLVYGGLNYQIEHHLFPAMPRNRLADAAPIVRAFCAEHGLSYHQTSALQSYREMFRDFQAVSNAL
jgi:fatty acid desaturase